MRDFIKFIYADVYVSLKAVLCSPYKNRSVFSLNSEIEFYQLINRLSTRRVYPYLMNLQSNLSSRKHDSFDSSLHVMLLMRIYLRCMFARANIVALIMDHDQCDGDRLGGCLSRYMLIKGQYF